MKPIINIENLSKQYRLGTVGTGSFAHDVNRWWYRVRGKEDPYLQIGETNDRTKKGNSDYVWALKDINLKVMPGEVLGVIGKNGAGKSTLLKLLSRVTTPTTGGIEIRGRMASLLEVGTGFHPELTGKENVFLNGAILGMTKAEVRSKLDEIVSFAGCERYIDTPVKRYSSGMKVRLAFAVAAHLEPDILVVDEVLAVGDAEFQAKAIGKMQDVSKGEGRTVLFVSHNMASIQSLCTRGLLLKDGQVFSEGNIGSIISDYMTINAKENDASFYVEETDIGNKNVWIDSAHLKSNGEVTNQAASGDDLSLVINYKAKELGLKCSLYIGVYDKLGDKLLHLGTGYGMIETFSTKKEGTLICKIENLPLPEGVYQINLSMHLNGRPYHRVESAMRLLIEGGDFFGTGKIPDAKESKFFVTQDWKLV